MSELPYRIYVSIADYNELIEEQDFDLGQNPDVTGSTKIYREYIRNDDGKFVPEEWGWQRDTDYGWVLNKMDKRRLVLVNKFNLVGKEGQIIYSGPLTPTLYRLIAEANGIPLPQNPPI